MFALGIRYLMGWAMAAADGSEKRRPEWPPHPDRVFMALAAGWFETGQDQKEGATLRWLEQLPPPSLTVSTAEFRHAYNEESPTKSYVPVNDARLSLAQLPNFRPRQPRRFPVAIPRDPIVHFSWDKDLPETHHEHLEALCRKVTSIGHSASLVQIWLTEAPPPVNLVPISGPARHRMRITAKGRLDYLEARCNRQAVIRWSEMDTRFRDARGKEKETFQVQISTDFPSGRPVSLRPEPWLWQGYDVLAPEKPEPVPGSLFDPRLVVLSLSGKKVSLPVTFKLTDAVRGALLKACPEPIPEWLSGHSADGSPTGRPHLALFPLPFVGSPHADGHVMGLALAVPRNTDPEESSRILEPWLRNEQGTPRRIRLFNGHWLECYAELYSLESRPWNLRPETWTGPERIWATVTPVVLDRHFDGKDRWEKASESTKDSCERIGLPRPTEVILQPFSIFEGVPQSNQFPWLNRKQAGGRLQHAHAVLVFEQKVEGPVVIGAGRFRGYGLCRPIRQGGGSGL